jgi:DNA invertase Pin-like site-specific DNA recombinase
MYAMLLRKSRSDLELEQIEKLETLAKHKQILTDLAKSMNLNVVEIYKEVITGENLEDRPEMQRLIKDLYQNKYKGVLVMNLDRLARGNAKDQGIVSEAFKMTNTLIITPQKIYDPNNMSDEDFIDFGLFMARFEYKAITRRMVIGKQQAIKEGNFMGAFAPFGYDIDKRGRNDRTLKPNQEADIVKMIFNWYTIDKLSAGEIGIKLTDMKIPTPSKNKEWNRATIKEIVNNEVYIGKIKWHNRKVTKELENGIVVKKNRRQKEYELYNGKHPALVTEQQFYEAKKLAGSAPKGSKTNLINPLASILKCKHCGKTMLLQTFKSARPRITHRVSQFCKVKSSYYDDVYNGLIQALKLEVEDFEFKLTNEYEVQKIKEQKKQIAIMKKELELLEEQQEELYNLLERKVYTEKIFMKRNSKIQSEIEELEAKIEQAKTVEEVDYSERIIKLKDVIETLQDDNIDPKLKNDFLKEVIERIDYSIENGELILEVY